MTDEKRRLLEKYHEANKRFRAAETTRAAALCRMKGSWSASLDQVDDLIDPLIDCAQTAAEHMSAAERDRDAADRALREHADSVAQRVPKGAS